jgi:hypothetical protein
MKQFWKDEHFSVRWKEIPESAGWRGEWKDFCRLPRNAALRYLFVMHHKSEQSGLGNLNVPTALTYLHLLSSNARTIGSVPAGLRRLEMHRCVKLESADGLAESCPELRHLHIDISKKFRDLPNLLKLKKLEVLCLSRCGDLPDLKFLAKFPNLRDFRFVDTNVLDGDLSPLLTLPKLESVGTLNKKHYSPTADEIKEALASRSGASRRITALWPRKSIDGSST